MRFIHFRCADSHKQVAPVLGVDNKTFADLTVDIFTGPLMRGKVAGLLEGVNKVEVGESESPLDPDSITTWVSLPDRFWRG
ncbi:hypothetical protein [Micromonospora globbae]|uniref:hypothetical protein n=1 Tax=Micromonospora globbae TaxID=1894969 RepID=UPI0011C48EC1|nr:hypothetical protein [Micromonospora globbae]WTF88794.1 hypothetical protein OH732_15035 [Micromonospora globbae]